MRGWIILLVILVVVALLLQLRLGGIAHYGADGLIVRVLAGPFRVQLFPRSEEKTTDGKSKKKAAIIQKDKKETQEHGKAGSVGRLLDLLPVVKEAVGELKRRIRIDDLALSVIWGGNDPASVAMGYGGAYAIIGMIYPVLENNFKIKHSDFQVEADYGRAEPEVSIDATFTMTAGQLIHYVLVYGIKFIKSWVRSGKKSAEEQEA